MSMNQFGEGNPKQAQVIARKGPALEIVAANPETRRAIWRLVMEHGATAQKVSRMLGVTQRAVTAAIRARHHEEIDKAIMWDRLRRGPLPPAAGRRAA